MKMRILVVFASILVAIGTVLYVDCVVRSRANRDGDLAEGSLVLHNAPLGLSVYADTNLPFGGYTVFEKNKLVLSKEVETNDIVLEFGIKGRNIFEVDCDKDGNVIRQFINVYYENSMMHKYVYIDTNGDGLFDIFITYGKDEKRNGYFVRSNLCWVPLNEVLTNRL